MKFITKIVIVFAVIFSTTYANAQVKFGIKAGLNRSNISIGSTVDNFFVENFTVPAAVDNSISNGNGYAQVSDFKKGFQIGVISDIKLNDKFSFQSELSFVKKGYELTRGFNSVSDLERLWTRIEVSRSLKYIEMPLSVVLHLGKFQISAGPYLALGIGGEEIINYTTTLTKGSVVTTNAYTEEFKLKPVSGELDLLDNSLKENEIPYTAFDFGINSGVGFEFYSFLINVEYSLGISNLAPKIKEVKTDQIEINIDRDGLKYSNEGFNVSISYFFKK